MFSASKGNPRNSDSLLISCQTKKVKLLVKITFVETLLGESDLFLGLTKGLKLLLK